MEELTSEDERCGEPDGRDRTSCHQNPAVTSSPDREGDRRERADADERGDDDSSDQAAAQGEDRGRRETQPARVASERQR